MIRWFRKQQEIEKKERAQYSEAVRTLNQELMAKTKVLVEETHRFEEVKKVKTNLAGDGIGLSSLTDGKDKGRRHGGVQGFPTFY